MGYKEDFAQLTLSPVDSANVFKIAFNTKSCCGQVYKITSVASTY
jgi:hypothetical protein